MRQSANPPLRRGQKLDVEAGLFDVRNLGQVERVVVVANGQDHILVEFRRRQYAIPKGRGYIMTLLRPPLIDAAPLSERGVRSQLFGSG